LTPGTLLATSGSTSTLLIHSIVFGFVFFLLRKQFPQFY
jgi:hypothetical protein